MSLQKCTEALKQLTFTPTLKRKRIRSNSYRVVPLEFAPKGYDFYVSFGNASRSVLKTQLFFSGEAEWVMRVKSQNQLNDFWDGVVLEVEIELITEVVEEIFRFCLQII